MFDKDKVEHISIRDKVEKAREEQRFSKAQAVIMAKSFGLNVDAKEQAEAMEVVIKAADIAPDTPKTGNWLSGEYVVVGSERTYGGKAYTCLQTHVTQSGWTPDLTPALWMVKTQQGEEWVQPQGAHDAYMKGAVVTFNGKTWISEIDNNVWQPGVYGWVEQA